MKLFNNTFEKIDDYNDEKVKTIKKITNFNPYEIHNLSSKYTNENLEDQKELEILEEKYYASQKNEMNTSHSKFMNEFCLNNTNVMTDFFNCLHLMDTDDTMMNLDQNQIIIDQNLMYFHEESKRILSISPIAAKFLRNQYPVNIESKERKESALIMYKKTEGSAKGTAFEEIIRFLVKTTNSFPFFIKDANEKKENVQVITPNNLYLDHNEFQSIFQGNDPTFISIENYHHDLIDAVYIGKQKIEGQKSKKLK